MAEDKKGGGSEGGYFGRFVFALLATVLTILIVQSSFSLIVPDIGRVGEAPTTFFRDFGTSLGRIQFPELPGPPGVPDYLRDLFGAPTAPTGPTTLPPTTTPPTPPAKKPFPWWILILLLVLGALGGGGYLAWKKGWLGIPEERHPTEQPALQIVGQIGEILNNKTQAIDNINRIQRQKHTHITAGDMNTAIVQFIEAFQEDPALLWETIRRINVQGDPVKQLGDIEEQLLNELTTLKGIEIDFYNILNNQQWLSVLRNLGVQNLDQDMNELNNLLFNNLLDPQKEVIRRSIEEMNEFLSYGHTPTPLQIASFIRTINNLGIIRLIIVCHNFEKHEQFLVDNNLDPLFQERNIPRLIEVLIRDKYAGIKNLIQKLKHYDEIEGRLIEILTQKAASQRNKLQELRRKITERVQQVQAQQAAAAQQQAAAPNFALSVNPTTLTIQQGNHDNSIITVTSQNGFNADVNLSVPQLPQEVTATFNPDTVRPQANAQIQSTLTINLGQTTPPGTHNLTINGVSGAITQTHTVNLTLIVPQPTPQQRAQFLINLTNRLRTALRNFYNRLRGP